jgi:hypothetical protein
VKGMHFSSKNAHLLNFYFFLHFSLKNSLEIDKFEGFETICNSNWFSENVVDRNLKLLKFWPFHFKTLFFNISDIRKLAAPIPGTDTFKLVVFLKEKNRRQVLTSSVSFK